LRKLNLNEYLVKLKELKISFFLEFLGILAFELKEWALVLKFEHFLKTKNIFKNFKQFLVLFEEMLDCFFQLKFTSAERNYMLTVLLTKFNLVFDLRFMNFFLLNLNSDKDKFKLKRKKEEIFFFFSF
jgi:hypothetical protein